MDYVILVDENDAETGVMEKMEAHRKGVLHRAFSVLIYNSKGELLIQQRSSNKYHSADLWTNTCCSHPRPGESVQNAAERRLMEEMGIVAQLKFSYKFSYRAALENGLIENEVDYVFTGIFDGYPNYDRDEVKNWKFVSFDWLIKDVVKNGENYTTWFKLLLNHQELNLG